MPLISSQILEYLDFTKIQKSKYLENETLFFLQIKKTDSSHKRLLYGKK